MGMSGHRSRIYCLLLQAAARERLRSDVELWEATELPLTKRAGVGRTRWIEISADEHADP
jgi:hypothetical protein